MNTENRQLRRAPLDLLFNTFQSGVPALCVATDVSEGGIGLRRVRDSRRLNGALVDVEFQLPGVDSVIVARGRIRDSPHAAVVFEQLASEDRERIKRYVDAA